MPLIVPPAMLNTKKSKIPRKKQLLFLQTKSADDSNDVAEVAAGSQYDEFDVSNRVNSNGSNLCGILIGDKAFLYIDADIDTSDQNSVDDGGLME